MKILLTGAEGQLGRALRSVLDRVEWIAAGSGQLDVRDRDQVRAAIRRDRPDLIINAAAYTDVDGAESAADLAFAVNAEGPRNLAEATVSAGVPLLHVSTDYVFDGRADRPYHEDDPTSPRSVYGASKLAGEEAVRALQPRHFVVRTAWLYHTSGENFPLTMLALKDRPEVRVVNDQVGSPTYAPHLAAAIGKLVGSDSFGTYHMAGSGSTTWFEMTRTLYGLLGIETPVRPVTTDEFPRAAERPRYSVLTTIREPRIVLPPWQEGLREFADGVRVERGTQP